MRPWVLLAGVAATIALVVHAALTGSVGGLLVAGIFALIGYGTIRRRPAEERHAFLLVFAVAATAAVFVFHENEAVFGGPYWAGGSDDLTYEQLAEAYRDRFRLWQYAEIQDARLTTPSGAVAQSWFNSFGYVWVVALVGEFLTLLGFPEAIIGFRLLNSLLLGLSCVLTIRIGKHLGLTARSARITALAVTLQPLMLWIAGHTLRDILIGTLLLSLVFLWVRLEPRSTGASIAKVLFYSVIIVGALTQLRLGQAYIAAVICAVGLWKVLGAHRGGRAARVVLAPLAMVVVVLGVLADAQIARDTQAFVGAVEGYVDYLTLSVGGGFSRFIFETPYPFGAFLRVAYLLVSPIPVVDVVPMSRLLLGIATLFNVAFLYFLMRGLRLSLLSDNARIVAVAFVGLFLGVALVTFTFRQVATFFPLGGVLVALSLEKFSPRHRRSLLAIGFLLGLGFFAPYLLLR